MSSDKDKDNCTEHACCDSDDDAGGRETVSTVGGSTIQSETTHMGEFIDIHGTHMTQERLGTSVEERGERSRVGGSTVAEVAEQFSQKCVADSDEEFHSADDGDDDGGDEDWDTGGAAQFTDAPMDDTFAKSSVKCENSRVISESEAVTVGEASGGGDVADNDALNDEDSKPDEIVDDEECRKKAEDSLTDEEKLERKVQSQATKDRGNQAFREGSYRDAIALYNEALDMCPLSFPKDRSIMFSNRAACQVKLENTKDAISSCTKALDLHPQYMKALLRRAELYEQTDKLDEALTDYQKVLELDPSQHAARHTALRLADQVKERNEKMKTEMLGKLKDLGNLILKPFGMSTDNFNLQQDPSTGSYSVNFQQK